PERPGSPNSRPVIASRRTRGICPPGGAPALGVRRDSLTARKPRRSAMFFSLWRRLRENNLRPSRGDGSRRDGHLSFRPRLEPLEGRMLPASGAFSSLQPIVIQPHGAGANNLKVTVVENSPKTVIDLGAVFANISGIRHEDGLQLSMLGNTNPGLVKTAL